MKSLLTGSLVPQATLFPLHLPSEELEPWTFWEKLTIMSMFSRHAAYESVNTAVWRLAGNATVPPLYLAVTDNTVAAQGLPVLTRRNFGRLQLKSRIFF
jgi:hypothetical protein